MNDDFLEPIYDSVNWDLPHIRCHLCNDIAWPPTAGSHPSSLLHYEASLGPLNQPKTAARILIVLQDPRPNEKSFTIADPRKNPTSLCSPEARYFCLTRTDWYALGLNILAASNEPCWPSLDTAPHYLRRYYSKSGWSYNGFLAYFVYLFRPTAAVITNIAKCHFGDGNQDFRVYERCAREHLQREVELLEPNLVISFSSAATYTMEKCIPELKFGRMTRIELYHPAAQVSRREKRQRFGDEVELKRHTLRELGYDVKELKGQWERDSGAASTEQKIEFSPEVLAAVNQRLLLERESSDLG